jgi:hypothetical protein
VVLSFKTFLPERCRYFSSFHLPVTCLSLVQIFFPALSCQTTIIHEKSSLHKNNLVCSVPFFKVNLSRMHKPTKCTRIKLFNYTSYLFIIPTNFGHSCDHLEGVIQSKYQKYNINYIKYVIKFSKILSIIKVA